jgi:hypothetical protein
MAMPNITLTKTDTGSTAYVIPDFFMENFHIGLQAIVTGSVSSYSAEFTLDDTTSDSYVPASGNWFPVSGMDSLDISAIANLTIPCRGIRLTIETGTGTVALTIQQAGTR